jgi:hypothetical protein
MDRGTEALRSVAPAATHRLARSRRLRAAHRAGLQGTSQLLLGNGFMARRGVKQARALGPQLTTARRRKPTTAPRSQRNEPGLRDPVWSWAKVEFDQPSRLVAVMVQIATIGPDIWRNASCGPDRSPALAGPGQDRRPASSYPRGCRTGLPRTVAAPLRRSGCRGSLPGSTLRCGVRARTRLRRLDCRWLCRGSPTGRRESTSRCLTRCRSRHR